MKMVLLRLQEDVMRSRKTLIAVLLVALALASSVSAQENGKSQAAEKETRTATEIADGLRLQLIEVQSKEETLRIRLEQLDFELKPENIERSLAGIGSTRPEELREYRRRQLTIERDGVSAQLRGTETTRVRLEAAVATAEARAYQFSASPQQHLKMQAGSMSRGFFIAGIALLLLLLGGTVAFIRRETSITTQIR